MVEKLSSVCELTQNQTKQAPHLITVISASSSRDPMVNAAVVPGTPLPMITKCMAIRSYFSPDSMRAGSMKKPSST